MHPDQRSGGFELSREMTAVAAETFESLAALWLDPGSLVRWDCPFVLPPWLKVWWDVFGGGMTPLLCSIRQGDNLLGIAPLMRQGESTAFVGSSDVCDYLDFMVVPGKEPVFFRALIEHLRQLGIRRLDLGAVRRDSTVLNSFLPLVNSLEYQSSCEQVDVSLELDLPETWEQFLGGLTGKERHEVRRKIRRLEASARVRCRVVEGLQGIRNGMEIFLELMKLSRPEKAAFMTDRMTVFFRTLAEALAEVSAVKLFFLDLDDKPAAAAFCFDYHDTVYLYNSGYDPQFRWLSAGLLNKVFSIRESIERGRKKYDFLKGAETYKHRLGGQEIPLYRCQIALV
jgi:CelD/BcsL family acetyltransferase involved in cellulose biosynthesis